MKTNSPFRYAGGKFYARKLILECIPTHTKYCELFAGGASIFFSKSSVDESILNDKDEELINCYLHIRDHVEELIEKLKGIPANKEMHKYYKNEFSPKNDLERAFRWFYLNRTSYSGIMKHENCYWGYDEKYSMTPEKWPNRLVAVSKKLQNVKIISKDFEEVLETLPSDYFVFVDPPYFNADQKKLYTFFFKTEDHIRLSESLKKHQNKVKFLITYDNSEKIKELYSWCESILEKEWKYTISRTDNQRKGLRLKDGFKGFRHKNREMFIANYSINDSLHENQ